MYVPAANYVKPSQSLLLYDCLKAETATFLKAAAAHRECLLVRFRDMDAVSQELHGKLQRTQAELMEAQHQVLDVSLWRAQSQTQGGIVTGLCNPSKQCSLSW